MKLFSFLALTMAVAVSALRGGETKRRGLILDFLGGIFDIFGGGGDDFCGDFVGGFVGDTVTCECDFAIFPPSGTFDCATANISPSPEVIGANIALNLTVNLVAILQGTSPVNLNLCLDNADVFGVAVPPLVPFCIAFESGILSLLGLIDIPLLPIGVGDEGVLADFSMCKASFGDECSSCAPCMGPNNTQGIIFDCGDVAEGLSTGGECVVIENFPRTTADMIHADQIHIG